MPQLVEDDIQRELAQSAAEIAQALRRALDPGRLPDCALRDAMAYSLLAPGKRIRPVLTLWSCELCGGSRESAMPAAVAVECVHTFSLIHDDLPAIDNDDLRRGQPSNHKKFGEALAILAGDALLVRAFEVLATEIDDPETSLRMIRELSEAAGWQGLIAGEAADIEGETAQPSTERVAAIHEAKTARLIQSACRLGALAANAATWQMDAMSDYGRYLGLAFQAADDLLDVAGKTSETGKQTGKDARSGKQTYPRVVGMEAAQRHASNAAKKAIDSLRPFGESAERLSSLARFVVERRS